MNNVQQILPGFTVRSDAYFSNFYTTPVSSLVVSALIDMLQQPGAGLVYICGIAGTGKSHLLQAVCHLADEQAASSVYLPLAELKEYNPQDILENIGHINTVCIDDLDAIVGDDQWEEALFHCYNQRMALGVNTVFAAQQTVVELPLRLPDLKTRLSACLAFQLTLLADKEKMALIQFRANITGMEINDACSQFIIQHSGRHLEDLVCVLERLDKESLVAGRKITVPFIKSIFAW